MSVAVQTAAYPAAMDRTLRQIRRRRVLISLARGFLIAAAVLLMTMLFAMCVDGIYMLASPYSRAALTVSALGTAAMALASAGMRPWLRARRLRHAAGDIDASIPQLEERWTTVAHCIEGDWRSNSLISHAMLRQVTSEVVATTRFVDPARVVPYRTLRRPILSLSVAATVVAAMLAWNWPHHRILLLRFWSPWRHLSATQLDSITGDLVVPRGNTAEIRLQTKGVPRSVAMLTVVVPGAEPEQMSLPPTGESAEQFRYVVEHVDYSFQYQVQVGDAVSDWHRVTVIDYPSLADVRLTVTAPSYVERADYVKDYLPDRVRVVQGSRLRLEMRPAEPVQQFELVTFRAAALDGDLESSSPPERSHQLQPDNDGWYRYEATLVEDVSLRPVLLSRHQLRSQRPPECHFRVIPDRAPVAKILSPTDEIALSPDSTLEVKFEAHDDHGIAQAELVIYEEAPIPGEPPTVVRVENIPLGDQQNRPHVTASASLDLSRLALPDGAQLSFAIRVTDNRREVPSAEPPAPPQAASSPVAAQNSASALAGTYPQPSAPAPTESASRAVPESGAPESSRRSFDAPALSPPLAATPRSPVSERERESDDTGASGQAGSSEQAAPLAQTASSKTAAVSEPVRAPASAATSESEPTAPEATRTLAARESNRTEGRKTDAPRGAAVPAEGPHRDPGGESPTNPPSVPLEASARLSSEQNNPDSVRASSPAASNDDSPSAPTRAAAVASAGLAESRSGMTHPSSAVTDDLLRQHAESNRLKLKIEKKLVSAAATTADTATERMQIRQRLEQIDRELQLGEERIVPLVGQIPPTGLSDAQVPDLQDADGHLASAERIIAELRAESKDTPYAFTGLQMIEIGLAHLTPARDRVFSLIRQPAVDAPRNIASVVHGIGRARELLAALLVRYDRAVQEESLAATIEQTAKMYEVYVSNLHRFLRAQTRPNPNPLQRKMAIVEVDQAYLDRLRQVTEMRRDLMAEFARMLGDDPRLLSKYIDLIRRRQTSLRDRLTELHMRQEALATEVSGWLNVDETQREDVWLLIAEVRLQELAPLTQEFGQFEERVRAQFPLGLDPSGGTPSQVIEAAQELALGARSATTLARRLQRDPFDESIDLAADLERLERTRGDLELALQQLSSESADAAVMEYADRRHAELQTLAERMTGWTDAATYLRDRRFAALAGVDQEQLARKTEILRLDIDGMETQLSGEFQGQVPPSVSQRVAALRFRMESITFHQIAATFELQSERVDGGAHEQQAALADFEQAEDLFDELRRTVVTELDKMNPPNPNIADLRDPTLDEVLERLEREPNLGALLGLPNRPRNLRVMSDFFVSSEGSVPVPEALEKAAEAARDRARREQQVQRDSPPREEDPTEKEWREIADATEAQQKLQERIQELRRQAEERDTDSTQAEQLRQAAAQLEDLERQLAPLQGGTQQWQQMVRSDQMRAVLQAAARGEPLPDTQWNRLMSSLGDGLWQSRRRVPPQEYRTAIEQYQERIRKLRNLETRDEGN